MINGLWLLLACSEDKSQPTCRDGSEPDKKGLCADGSQAVPAKKDDDFFSAVANAWNALTRGCAANKQSTLEHDRQFREADSK